MPDETHFNVVTDDEPKAFSFGGEEGATQTDSKDPAVAEVNERIGASGANLRHLGDLKGAILRVSRRIFAAGARKFGAGEGRPHRVALYNGRSRAHALQAGPCAYFCSPVRSDLDPALSAAW